MLTFEKEQEYPELQWQKAMKKSSVEVHAVSIESPITCITLEGKVEVVAGSVIMRGADGEYYPVRREKFDLWYGIEIKSAPVGPGFTIQSGTDYPNFPWAACNKKPVPVDVCQIKEPFLVKASWGDLKGKPGDYLAMYGPGDYAAIANNIFAKTYEFIGN